MSIELRTLCGDHVGISVPKNLFKEWTVVCPQIKPKALCRHVSVEHM
jgi:hypothetical protein